MESGNLVQKGVLSLLTELCQAKATGSLKLERAPLQKAVYLRDGQILFAASNDPKDQLASILVEEGKLGPDQMQIAQARVSPGNPLAKVLTELGYISQRELADAARLKVEKILTDLFGWKEGNHQFAEGSLPKGAIDLELSTPRLMFNSIRRMQRRDWVLEELGSLDSVFSPTGNVATFLKETEADEPTQDILRFVDGVKTITQIGALSSLTEFEVCKVLAGAQLLGAVSKARDVGAVPEEPAREDVLSLSPDEILGAGSVASSVPEPLDQTILDTEPKTLGLEQPPIPPPEPLPPPPQMAEPVQTPAPSSPPLVEPPLAPPPLASIVDKGTPSLLLDEPESPEEPVSQRVPLSPHRMSEGAGNSQKKLLIGVAGLVLLISGIAAGYYFIWPMFFSAETGSTDTPKKTATSQDQTQMTPGSQQGRSTTPTSPAIPPPAGPTASKGQAGTTPAKSAASGDSPPESASDLTKPAPKGIGGEQSTPSSAQKSATAKTPSRQPPTASAKAPTPKKQTTTTQKPSRPGTDQTNSPSSMARSHELLQNGKIPEAANIHLQHLRSTNADNKFTIAVGVYCDTGNATRAYRNSGNSKQLIVLPYSYRGRSCYRVFWGLFDSEESARSNAASLPTALRSPDSVPVSVSKLIR